MTGFTVTIHAIQTIEVPNQKDAKKAIEKAMKKLTDDWKPIDATAVDNLGNSFSEDLYD